MEENHLKDSYYFRQCWNQCERDARAQYSNISMGKLPFFTRVEVYEGAYVILKFNGMEESLSPNEAKGG